MEARERLIASTLGSMVGDALGLPYEGLTPRRARHLLPGLIRPQLFPKRMMVSDDGEHALMTTEALLSSGDVERVLRRRLRSWFLLLSVGMGLATLRACLRLCLGLRPRGVPSAGNGAAMRAATIGAYHADDPKAREATVERVARLTHTDERAVMGARLVALAAACAAHGEQERSPAHAQEIAPDWPLDFASENSPSGYVFRACPPLAAVGCATPATTGPQWSRR